MPLHHRPENWPGHPFAETTSGFVACPANLQMHLHPMQQWWQMAIYQAAYHMALEAAQPRFSRHDLFAHRN